MRPSRRGNRSYFEIWDFRIGIQVRLRLWPGIQLRLRVGWAATAGLRLRLPPHCRVAPARLVSHWAADGVPYLRKPAGGAGRAERWDMSGRDQEREHEGGRKGGERCSSWPGAIPGEGGGGGGCKHRAGQERDAGAETDSVARMAWESEGSGGFEAACDGASVIRSGRDSDGRTGG